MNIKGQLHLQLLNLDREIVAERHISNMIVDTGRHAIARNYAGLSNLKISHFAVGKSNITTLPSMNNLENALDGYFKVADLNEESIRIGDYLNNATSRKTTAYITGSLASDQGNVTGSDMLHEAALFFESYEEGSDEPTYIMYNRVTFEGIPKTPDFLLEFKWKIVF